MNRLRYLKPQNSQCRCVNIRSQGPYSWKLKTLAPRVCAHPHCHPESIGSNIIGSLILGSMGKKKESAVHFARKLVLIMSE